MEIAAIVATGLNNEIGLNNKLLWHLPADLKFFKSITMGSPVIMGRKTYESIGKLLPGRKNIIITRQKDFKVDGALVHSSPTEALKHCHEEKVFVIGGAEIYTLCLPYCSEVYRTLVKASFKADTFFTNLEKEGFKKVWEECHSADEKNAHDFCFEKWVRP